MGQKGYIEISTEYTLSTLNHSVTVLDILDDIEQLNRFFFPSHFPSMQCDCPLGFCSSADGLPAMSSD